ncbi:UPF0103-domain-containing protein [Anaeromyces robustus]|uniref:UPF0103-domain-containing protein n=1 Tax=Anaeromyces robustus TaxID=1754192 RepID=A0A1Y1WPR1_9FUNG|nr:UPF0103-domain-containing protein [Anaeromyces robustus]|eukprot:ORX75527.1 UPF0103-domain-containing protein [Anaeromyces robustus]
MLRRAIHAGSWYHDSPSALSEQIENWMKNVPNNLLKEPKKISKGLIAPHAGYTYCGQVMAHSYKYITPDNIKRIFIFGPSHRVYIKGCALPQFSTYECPLGDMEVDTEICEELEKTKLFTKMTKNAEEQEHSIEMELPFISWVMGNQPFKIVPIIFGVVPSNLEKKYIELFKPYLEQPDTFFIISSDFCHWGERFDYTYLPPIDDSSSKVKKLIIADRIEILDREAMKIIESGNSKDFEEYLDRTDNTICGRTGIKLLLSMFEKTDLYPSIKFLKYGQSNRVSSKNDGSVSYATAIINV